AKTPSAREGVMRMLRGLTIGLVLACAGASLAEGEGFQGRAQRGELDRRLLPGGTKRTPALSSTVLRALEQGSVEPRAAEISAAASSSSSNAQFLGLSRGTLGCGAGNTDGNIRVNQDGVHTPRHEPFIESNRLARDK